MLKNAVGMIKSGRYLKNLAKTIFFPKKKLYPDLPSDQADRIDVTELLQQYSVEELCEQAEAYYQRLGHWNYHLAIPFSSPDTVVETLSAFTHLLTALHIVPDMTVLDFAAGSCWASHWLNQMGCEVISLDAAPTALKIGQTLSRQHPVFGSQPPHTFLPFQGRTIDLPDNRVDRIICMDAFHHVPNQREILQEMYRVLREEGIAGFSEPGPAHSRSAQAQYEMKHHHVIENDIVLETIFALAEEAGFAQCQTAIYHPFPFLVSWQEFTSFLHDRGFISADDPSLEYLKNTIAYMNRRRMFVLVKNFADRHDSRTREGLKATVHATLKKNEYHAQEPIELEAVVTNTSKKLWLPATARVGAVYLGCHLLNPDGTIREFGYYKARLTSDDRSVQPGETLRLDLQIPAPEPGHYLLECDVVSEGVTWFSINGSVPVRLALYVK